MDQQIRFGFEADKSTIDGVNSLKLDSDVQPFRSQCNGVSEHHTKSVPMHCFSRGDFILAHGQHALMSYKKKCSPHLRHDSSALLHGGKKRRENGRNLIPYKNLPWVKQNYLPNALGLHEEIEDFYEYMKPTDNERNMRKYVMRSVKDVVQQLLPNAEVDVFGSFRTDLYLPTSDIDMVVFGEWKSLPMEPLKEELIRKGVAKEESVKVLDRAAVPIIKFQHLKTKVKVDISFNMKSGVQSVDLVKDFLKKFPSLPKLMFVLKQFLLVHDLNEVWTGGLSSYSLLLMCVSFLQLHPSCDPRQPNNNLGVLLYEFFNLYGCCFNYESVCIRVKNGGSYITKEEFCQQLENGSAPSILCIEDPLTRGNDLGKGTYAMLKIQQIFHLAARLLSSCVHNRLDRTDECHQPVSYLSRIVTVPDHVIEYRKNMCDRWRDFVLPSTLPLISNAEANSLGLPERYNSSSSSSTESDFEERQHFPPKPIHRARSCDSLSHSQTMTRKLRTMQNRLAPVRMHSADNRHTYPSKQNVYQPNNFVSFPADQSSHFRGAGESVNEQIVNGKPPFDGQHHPRLVQEDVNRLENRGDTRFINSRIVSNGSPPNYRGRPTTARGHSNVVNHKYAMQRPVSVGNGRWFER